jgi:hypothetical protein
VQAVRTRVRDLSNRSHPYCFAVLAIPPRRIAGRAPRGEEPRRLAAVLALPGSGISTANRYESDIVFLKSWHSGSRTCMGLFQSLGELATLQLPQQPAKPLLGSLLRLKEGIDRFRCFLAGVMTAGVI